MPRKLRSNTRLREVKKRVRKKSLSSFVFIAVVSLFFVVYLGGYISKMLTKQEIPTVRVVYGSIGTPDIIKGIITRSESVYNSTAQGALSYNIADGQRIKKDSIVCYVQDEDEVNKIQTGLAAINNSIINMQKDRGDFFIFSEDVKRSNENIKVIVDEAAYRFLTFDMQGIYNMKKKLDNNIALRNQMMLGEEKGNIASMSREKEIYETQLEQSQTKVVSLQSGIVSYALDGLEDKFTLETLDAFTKEEMNIRAEINSTYQNKQVSVEEPIFKIVESNEWYISAYIHNNLIETWTEDSFRTIYLRESSTDTYESQEVLISKLVTHSEEAYVVMKCTKGIGNVLDKRNIEFKLVEKPIEGLKIPNTAIVDVSLFKVPLEYFSGDDNEMLLTKVTEEGPVAISPVIKKKDVEGGYALVLQDFTTLKLGDILINSDTNQQYQISELENAKGVYMLNTGIAEFRSIVIDEKTPTNSQFTILNLQQNSYIRVQDIIVSDAKNIFEGQSIF